MGISGAQSKSRAGKGIVKGEDEDGTSRGGQIVVLCHRGMGET